MYIDYINNTSHFNSKQHTPITEYNCAKSEPKLHCNKTVSFVTLSSVSAFMSNKKKVAYYIRSTKVMVAK